MARIAVGGFQHETNTFSPHPADLSAFENVAAFPRMPRGDALVEQMQDLNIGMGGFIQAARAAGHELVPTLWATAVPSGASRDSGLEAAIIQGLRKEAERKKFDLSGADE